MWGWLCHWTELIFILCKHRPTPPGLFLSWFIICHPRWQLKNSSSHCACSFLERNFLHRTILTCICNLFSKTCWIYREELQLMTHQLKGLSRSTSCSGVSSYRQLVTFHHMVLFLSNKQRVTTQKSLNRGRELVMGAPINKNLSLFLCFLIRN
jgi:hypothetical protein